MQIIKFVDYYFQTNEKYISRNDTVMEIGDFLPGKQQELQEFLDIISLQRKRKQYMEWLPPVDEKEIHLSFDQKEAPKLDPNGPPLTGIIP